MLMLWPRKRYDDLARVARAFTDTLELPTPRPCQEDGSAFDGHGSPDHSEWVCWDEPRVPLDVYGLVQGMASLSEGEWKSISGHDDYKTLLSVRQGDLSGGDWANAVGGAKEHLAEKCHDAILEAQENWENPGDLAKPKTQRASHKRAEAIRQHDERQAKALKADREPRLEADNPPEEGAQHVGHDQDQPNPQVVGPQPLVPEDEERAKQVEKERAERAKAVDKSEHQAKADHDKADHDKAQAAKDKK